MIPELYKGGKPFIASCAPTVFRLAHEGDSVAAHILDMNASALAECIVAAHAQIEGDGQIPVILGGSICMKESPFWTECIRKFLPEDTTQRTHLSVADIPPVFGALAEARGLADPKNREASFHQYRQNFILTYRF